MRGFTAHFRTVAFLAAASAALFSCRDDEATARIWALKTEKIETEQKIALLEVRLENRRAEADRRLTDIETKIAANERDIARLREKLVAAESAARPVIIRDAAMDARRQAWLGKHLDRLELIGGKELQDVKITSITDSGMLVRHAHGSARLGCDDFPPDRRKEFGLDVSLEKIARAEEVVRNAAYEKSIETPAAVVAARKREAEEKREQDALHARLAYQREQARIESKSKNRALAQPARRFGTGSIYSYRRYYGGGYHYYSPSRSVRYYNVYPSCGSSYGNYGQGFIDSSRENYR